MKLKTTFSRAACQNALHKFGLALDCSDWIWFKTNLRFYTQF